jgi:uncharacterized protein (TIGR02646 family)
LNSIDFSNYQCTYPKTTSKGAPRKYPCGCKNQPWDCKSFIKYKKVVKASLKKEFDLRCSYCLRKFAKDEDIIIHIEHVLPKDVYKKYTFEPRNLALSCPRCNTGSQKGTRIDFINNPLVGNSYNETIDFSLQNYKFIHPKIEKNSNFYTLVELDIDSDVFRRYKIINYHPKLRYTFKFFNLKKIEVGSLDSCMGVPRIQMDRIKAKYLKIPSQI